MKINIVRTPTALFTLTLFAVLTLGWPAVAAQEYAPGTGMLKGYIYKKDGKKPLWGVQVLLKNVTSGEIFMSNVTDSVGDYRILDVPAGDYQVLLMARDKSYEIKKIDFLIKIFEGKTSSISFSLKKSLTPLFFLRPCFLVALLAAVFAFIATSK